MINIDFTNIDNVRLIGRLLPFWSRGRWVSLFLQAILTPIATVHRQFQTWALERYIECHITSQKASLEWYLKHKLNTRFLNTDDNFLITQGLGDDDHPSCFSTGAWENNLCWDNSHLWNNRYSSAGIDYGNQKEDADIYVFAPALVETINYSREDYCRDIRYIMSKYMTNFNKINIVIANT